MGGPVGPDPEGEISWLMLVNPLDLFLSLPGLERGTPAMKRKRGFTFSQMRSQVDPVARRDSKFLESWVFFFFPHFVWRVNESKKESPASKSLEREETHLLALCPTLGIFSIMVVAHQNNYLSGGPRNDHDRRDPALRAQGCDTGDARRNIPLALGLNPGPLLSLGVTARHDLGLSLCLAVTSQE